MRKVALALTWLTLGLVLLSLMFRAVRFPGSIGIIDILPAVLLGIVATVHHTKPARAPALWMALVLCVLWGFIGIYFLTIWVVYREPSFWWVLLIAALTLGPAVPSAIAFYRRRSEWKQWQAAS
jgi:hypothetical protein